MAIQICDNCDKLLESGDLVKAVIISKFVALKSSRAYAIEKPTECLAMEHKNCQYPKTGTPDGD